MIYKEEVITFDYRPLSPMFGQTNIGARLMSVPQWAQEKTHGA